MRVHARVDHLISELILLPPPAVEDQVVVVAALADSLDERYGARSRRRIEIPNAMLQVMVDNLKAEAYQLRMRIVTRAASRGAPVEPAPQDHSHVEEELSEGDIQGSFAHGI